MKHLLPLLLLVSLARAEDKAPAPALQQTVGVSSLLYLDRPLELSAKITGFIKAENAEVVLHFDAEEIVSVHRFPNDKAPQSIIVIAIPLSTGRQDTFILIPEAVMPFDKVLEFVDGARRLTHGRR
jgi:hypothetical protein